MLIRIILFPFALIYDLVTRFRNHLYNIGYKKSFQFEACVLSVGNLSVGGTGKTPMVEYLVRLLYKDYKLATLSRGYGRKTRGFRLAGDNDTATTLGDEPFQFYKKFGDEIMVAVGEERAVAIPSILASDPDNDIIVLDDAYQHRSVFPNFSILLTEYGKPFFKDFLLPAGRLREARLGASRANVIVVTKCDRAMTEKEMRGYEIEIKKYSAPKVPIFFAGVMYSPPVSVFPVENHRFNPNVLLFSGIADAKKLVDYVEVEYNLLDSIQFSDHQHYTKKDVRGIIAHYNTFNVENKCILTTEKDMVKMLNTDFEKLFEGIPLFFLPITTYFLESGKAFDKVVLDSVANCASI